MPREVHALFPLSAARRRASHSLGRLKHQYAPLLPGNPSSSHPFTPASLAAWTNISTFPPSWHMYSHLVRALACCALAVGTTNRCAAPPTAQPTINTNPTPTLRTLVMAIASSEQE